MKCGLWPTRDSVRDYFPLPKEIFSLGLSAAEIAIYAYLLFCEDRQTFQCWPSYRKIGEAVGLSPNTIRKHIRSLEKRGLLGTEPTMVTTKDGCKRNGNLLFTIRPIQAALQQDYDRQMQKLDEDMAKRKYADFIERTAKAPIPACHARVGSLCGFRGAAERVPAGSPKTGRCANVRERCGNAKRRRREPAGGFRQRKKPQAAKQEKGLTLFCVRPSTSARSAGSFGG